MTDSRVDLENVESGRMTDSRVDLENVESLVERVRQIAYELHVYLGNGYLEKVYENGLRHRLARQGFKVEAQKPLAVYDEDGFCLGEYFADLVVEDRLVIELKSTTALVGEHFAQTLNYLKTTGLKHALLINFGSYKFETRHIVPSPHARISQFSRSTRQ